MRATEGSSNFTKARVQHYELSPPSYTKDTLDRRETIARSPFGPTSAMKALEKQTDGIGYAIAPRFITRVKSNLVISFKEIEVVQRFMNLVLHK